VAAWRTERWWEIAGRGRRLDGWWLGRGAFGFRGAFRESAALVWGGGGLIRCAVLIVCLQSCRPAGRASVSLARFGRPRFASAEVCLRSYLGSEWRGV
jgi:hypothetical protein